MIYVKRRSLPGSQSRFFSEDDFLSIDVNDWLFSPPSMAESVIAGVSWADPSDRPPQRPVNGTCYYNTKTEKVYMYDGCSWLQIASHTPSPT